MAGAVAVGGQKAGHSPTWASGVADRGVLGCGRRNPALHCPQPGLLDALLPVPPYPLVMILEQGP
jgi:hypothetical protein